MPTRRSFTSSALALSVAGLLGRSPLWGAASKSLDPVDAGMRFGITGALWGDWLNRNLRMSTDLWQVISDTARPATFLPPVVAIIGRQTWVAVRPLAPATTS